VTERICIVSILDLLSSEITMLIRELVVAQVL